VCYVFVLTCIQCHVKVLPCVKNLTYILVGNFGSNNAKGNIQMLCQISLKFCVMSSNNPVNSPLLML